MSKTGNEMTNVANQGPGQHYLQPGQPMSITQDVVLQGPGQHYPQPGQPMSIVQEWVSAPVQPINCPRGLEYLTMIDQLLVQQKVEVLEALTGFETNNKYSIKNSLGQKIYYATEDTDCCTRNCCGPIRPFDMKILDNTGYEVIHLNRPLRCQSCCFPCCLQDMEVTAGGQVIGHVKQLWSFWCPNFVIQSADRETMLRIEGPFCTMSCCCNDVKFKVLTGNRKKEVGMITKQWSGLLKEAFLDADNFGVTFPMDLDVCTKATLLGALFLIDFMYFERSD